MTTIKKCTCKSEYQDDKYGKAQRVHNKKTEKNGTGWRCTVCGQERN